MAIFDTFHYKLGNVWPREYIADNGEVFYLRRRNKEQLIFIAAESLNCAGGVENNATEVAEYAATAQMDAYGNECCAIERAGVQLHLNAKECRLGGGTLPWQERRDIIADIRNELRRENNTE